MTHGPRRFASYAQWTVLSLWEQADLSYTRGTYSTWEQNFIRTICKQDINANHNYLPVSPVWKFSLCNPIISVSVGEAIYLKYECHMEISVINEFTLRHKKVLFYNGVITADFSFILCFFFIHLLLWFNNFVWIHRYKKQLLHAFVLGSKGIMCHYLQCQ